MKTISYNFPDLPNRYLIKIAFLPSASLVAFILIFQPYDYNRLSLKLSVELITLVFVCTFFVSIICLVTLRSKFVRNVWQILIAWLFYTGVISQAIYFYTIVRGFNEFSWKGVGIYFITSLILSIIPFLVFLFIRKNSIIKPEYESGQMKFNGQVLQYDKIILFKSEDNYVRITFLDEKDEIRSTLERITMKEIFKESGNNSIFRVHRSYAINLDHFSHYSGNAKGYFVYLNHLEQKIPVSRSKGKNFIKRISSIRH